MPKHLTDKGAGAGLDGVCGTIGPSVVRAQNITD